TTSQILKPNEIVLVLDGEISDDLYNVISNFEREAIVKLVIVPKVQNEGLALALNTGLEFCSGNFIARMDADDISLPNRFLDQISFLLSHPEVDLVGGYMEEFNENSEKIFIRKYPLEHSKIRKYIARASPLSHPTVIFRKRVFSTGVRYSNL